MITWTLLSSNTNNAVITVPASNRYAKYWKLERNGTNDYQMLADVTAYNAPSANIHFATAPASGAVITADYTTKTIAKDANHVFDLTVTIQLGEYTG